MNRNIARPFKFANIVTSNGGTIKAGGRIHLGKHNLSDEPSLAALCNGYPIDYRPGQIRGDLSLSNGKLFIDDDEYTVIDGKWRAPGYRSGTVASVAQKRPRDSVSISDDDDDDEVNARLEREEALREAEEERREAERERAEALREAEEERREAERERAEALREVEQERREAELERREAERERDQAAREVERERREEQREQEQSLREAEWKQRDAEIAAQRKRERVQEELERTRRKAESERVNRGRAVMARAQYGPGLEFMNAINGLGDHDIEIVNAGTVPVRSPAAKPVIEATFSLLTLEGNSEKSEAEGMQCAMCLEHKKNVLLKPCRHICLCVECARALHEKPQCPVCRGAITGAELVFI